MKPTPSMAGAADLPEALGNDVRLWLEHFSEEQPASAAEFTSAAASRPELWRLVAGSGFAAGILAKEWTWFREHLSPGEVACEVAAGLPDTGVDDEVRSALRRTRNRCLLQVLWQEVAGYTGVDDTLRSLSALADSLVAVAVAHARHQVVQKFGVPRDERGEESCLIVLAMGKLGGCELNFSSDVDLIFLYSSEGESDGERQLSAQEYFARLSRRIVALLDDVTADGFVYRVDTRLRPFGESGPPVVSFDALESYLLRHGRDWERYAYVKARIIDTGAPEGIARALLNDIIEPFVYRRYLDYGVFEALREMKSLISAETRKRQLAENLKLGPGGIREIEFVVQSLQLVRGGGDRKLRTTGLQTALQRLARTRSLEADAAAVLADAYRFLRRMENFIQALRDQQEHDVPAGDEDRARLALVLGYAAWPALAQALARHRRNVERGFAAVAFRGSDESARTDIAAQLAALWQAGSEAGEWEAVLRQAGLREAEDVAARLVAFRRSTPVQRMGAAGGRRIARFVPELVAALAERERPALVAERVLGIVEQILRRSAYVALLNENPVVLERLVGLCDRSAWLAEEIGRHPLLLDELLDPRLYNASFAREEMQVELAERLEGFPGGDSERLIELLCQFKRALLFRIAVADISGTLPIMKVSDRLTELAEILLENVLSLAWEDIVSKHGKPRCSTGGRRREAGFGVIAYGKFGGMELSYSSDLDLVFLHDSTGSEQETDGDKPLDNNVFFARLVRRLVHFLTTRTPAGFLYQVDTRLRPSGRSGLLVSSVEGFERYQEDNAWTWEHQALLRSRPVAGSATVCREFERIRSETLKSRVRRERLREDVNAMRSRMREELDRSPAGRFDLKQGPGAIGDIEFIVQYLVLANAGRHPAVMHYPDNIRQLGVLGAAGCLAEADVARLQQVYRDYRLRLHHLALDEKAPEVGDDEFADERDFVMGLWRRIVERADEPGGAALL